MDYWSTIITEKSWKLLQKIRNEIDFILIGGWAVYLWAKSHKSKDIDIVIGYNELGKLKKNYNMKKNDNLRKYEIIIDEIDIDIYVPFYSRLPLLGELKNHMSKIEGFKVAKPEILLILKQSAEADRSNSEKGLKDRIDIMDLLLKSDINFAEYHRLIEKENLRHFKKRLLDIVMKFSEIRYIGLNPREFKLKKAEILNRISKI